MIDLTAQGAYWNEYSIYIIQLNSNIKPDNCRTEAFYI